MTVALGDTPVVLLNGARQTGKTTLAQAVANQQRGRYLTLDDPALWSAAVADPGSFIRAGEGLVVIDEVQKAPGLFVAIKREVDRDRSPGRFLLTGSADIFMLPDASESLAGRMEVLSLQPLARGELAGAEPDFIERAFANQPPIVDGADRESLAEQVGAGGFPEALTRRRTERRRAWFRAYVNTITQRDIRELANISDFALLPRLLNLLAARSGALANVAELARASDVPHATLHRYVSLLEASFLYQPLPAWHANFGKRLIKAPKVYLLDSGLACAVLGVESSSQLGAPDFGGLLETFVLGELRRIAAAMADPPSIFHYRSAGGVEVDFVIETAAGDCVGIEVKATASLGERHFSGLRDLEAGLGKRFRCGIVLYGGEHSVRFGPKLWAVPVEGMWSGSYAGNS